MDAVTNIVMDEDDVFAILTRRLILDHPFFRAPVDKHRDSPKIKTKKGKNLRPGDPYYTSLETLYAMNTLLLSSRARKNSEWSDLKMFKRFRPDEDYIDKLYEELAGYWDELLVVLPELKRDPPSMRCHDEHGEDDECQDSALFWPITQELMAILARDVMDQAISVDREAASALKVLEKVPWELHGVPWRHLVLIPTPDESSWRMRSEDRRAAIDVAMEIIWFQVGHTPLSPDALKNLRGRWEGLLLPALPVETINTLWDEIMARTVRA